MAESADWSRYLNYMLSTTDGGQSASSLNLNSRTFADQTAVDAFFAGLDALNNAGIYGNKAALTTLRIKLANGVNNAEIGGSTTVATGLATGLQVIVDPNGSTDTTHAGSVANTVQADNLIVLASTAAFSKGHIAHLAEQSGFAGTLDLTGLNMQTADGATLTTALNDLSADIKAKIKTLNLKLQSGNFGSATLTLSALTTGVTEFTGVTFNINRNGAIGGANASGSLVTVTNNTGHTVNLTDAEFHDMSTFDNASSAHWIGYLTHELNSAPAGYTLDLTVNAKLMLNSANSVAAFSSGLRYLPASLKTKVAVLKVKSSTNGNFGATDLNGPGSSERVIPEYAAFDTLASVVIEYTATGLNMGAYVGHLTNTNKYAYVSTPFNGMLSADWTRFFNYQLNAANIGGLGLTTISLDKRLSSADLTPVLGGLGAAANKASLTNLTLNLASDVTLDTNVGASGLTNLATFTLNTNGSAAKITPILSFVGKTELNSINNVKADSTDSWAAYLAGQGTIAAIDVREVELANQTAVTAFLTALEAESRKATVASLKLKLASAYTGTVDFSVNAPTTPIAGLTTLNDAGVEIHRNGSAATAVQGGSITDAKIKLVDLTASSFTDRSSAVSWRSYLTALIEATPGAVDLSTDSDTYLRTNAHLTAFMSGLNTLSPANKSSVTSLKLKLAPGAAWSDITALGQGLTGFTNLTSFIVDATGVYTSAGGNPQATIAFDGNITGKTIVTELASVDKDSQDSWTYFFNTAAMTAVDISSIPLTSAEATAFLAAVGTGTTPKTSITAVTLKLNPTFGAASLAINGSGFNATATAFTVHRNGAVDSGTPVSVAISNSSATLSIIDPTISDADAVLKTSASSWLAYLTNALAGVAPITLDLTDDNLVLGTMGQATALSAALDALGSTLKAKIATLKIKAAASVTIGATLTTAGGFTALTAIELNKPAAHTITVSTTGATTQLRIADLSNVKRDSSGDWLAYVQYLMKDLGAVTNFDLDMTGTNLAEGEVQAFVTALVTISANANSSGNRSKIQKVRLKLAPGAWSGNVTDLGTNWDGFMSNINTFTVDATGATVSGTQLYVGFHADLTDQSEYTKAFVTSLNSVDKDNADAWEFYLNYLTKDGPAALDLSGTTLSYVELNALDNGLGTFSIAAGNGNKLSSIHIKVSGAAGVSNYAIAANLDAQTAIASAAEFVVDVSGFTHSGSQATVSHTGGTPKAIELRISGASDLYRNSSASWDMYLNYVKGANANTMPATVDLTGSSSLYLRTQTDVDALMTAIQAHADKASISTLNVRLAPGSVGSDITFGTGVSVINPTMAITATGATNNGSMITSADIHYAGSFTSTSKTVTQTFATTVADQTSAQNWTKYLTYLLSSTADGGLGRVAIVIPALTSSTGLTVLMSGLNSLANPLKESIQHLHLDVSHASLNGALELGTGLSGLTNLIEVTYVRASAQADATAANGSSFENKIQRLRTAWNADSIASAITVVEYLRYVLMDAAMGGLEETLVDLTSQTLDNNGDSAVYTALAPNNQNPLSSLPTELKSRITEMRIKFNTDGGGGYAGITVPNLTKVKYFQTSSAVFVAPSSSATVTTTRFRALLADVADKAAQAQWTNYIDYVMSPIADGGLGQTTFDLSSITLTSAQIGPFLAALDAHASAANVTALTLKLDPTFGAASLDVSGYTHLTGLGANTVEIRRNAAVHAAAPVTITYGGSFTDANVKIVDPETNQTADKDNTRQQWLEYLTHTIHTVGLTSGLLTVAPGDAFTSQAHVYSLFDAMEALDPSLKAQVVKLIIDISSIATGTVSLMQTGNVALTGFDNLTDVIYKRGGIDTNIDTIIASLSAALDADADAIPTWIRADEGARDSAIGNAVSDGSIRNAIANGDVNGLKSALVTQLANGITFPAADACDAAVDAAAAAVSVTVDGDVKNTLATALVPFRSTGKISGITTALTTAFTNGGTTGFGTLSWLKSSWSSYADHAAVIAAVLADSTVNSAISTDGQTTANIKTAVAAKLNSMLIPTSGQLDTLIGAINLTALSGWNSNATTFVSSLRNQLIADLYTLMPWFDTDDSADPDSIVDFISEALTNLSYYFGGTHPAAEKWDLSNSGTAIKTQITPDLKATFGAEVSPAALSAAGRLSTMIDAAFTAADSGNAVTTNTAAWVRPTAGIETDLKASIKTALEALLWYTGDSDAQSTAAVTAGGVATNNAATIISNIKTYLTDNVSRPTADSIFSAGVNTAVNSINLAVVSTAVTTDFAGVAETLSRYRVNAADVTDPENGGQWTEYLLHKLDPVALGGLGATNIDASGAPLNNDKKNNFFAAINGLPDAYRKSITSIKLTASENVGNFDGGGKPYNNNLKIILFTNQSSPPTLSVALGQEFFAEDGTTPLVSGDVIEYRITTAPAFIDNPTAIVWTHWLNHKLSSTFGGDGVTAIDLSATHAFTTQAQLNEFFAGLEALDGTNGTANKNLLQSLTLKLASGNFGAASARIGHTGSAAVTGLKSDIAINIQRNGARYGVGLESAIVTINHSDIDALSSVDGVTVDNTDAVNVDNLSSSAEWLEYLNSTLTAATGPYTLDLTDSGLELTTASSATEATALFNALQALNTTLKAKIDTIKIKLAAGAHGAGALALSGALDNAAGFTALSRIIVDVTDAETDVSGMQKIINFSGVTVEAGVAKEARITALASVDLVSANATDSWLAYLNYITRTGTAALDTSAVNSGNGLTVAELNSVFDALANFSTANDNPSRLTAVTAKMAAAGGSGTFAVNQDLSNLSGLTSIIIDATDAMDSGAQVSVNFGGIFHASTVTKEARITALASVDLDNSDSWGYYLNYLKATNSNLESIDLSTRDLADTDSGTTQPNVDAFFTALEARADRTTVKDIHLNISGVDTLTLTVGTGSSTLTALTSVVIKRHAGATSTFTAAGDVAATDLAVINSAMGTLGASGTVAQWKGYFAYLLEDAAHGGAYTGSNPIAINLTATALQVNSLAVLQHIETVIAELPARLKARISAILIKTTDTSVDYTAAAAYEFGDAFTAPILAELSALKAVIIESCTDDADPVFDTDGDFFNTPSISKIVYHTTINII